MRVPVLTCLGLSTTALLVASCAPTSGSQTSEAGPTSAHQCFNVQQVTNFRQGRPDQIFLRVGHSDVYELNGAGGCTSVSFANRVALLPETGSIGGSRLCTQDWARIVVPGSTSPAETCRVRISRKLTDEEIAALPSAYAP